MKEQSVTAVIDLEKVRKWVSIVDLCFLAVRPQQVFEEMGFPISLVCKCVRKHRHLRLNNGIIGDGYSVSDGEILLILAEAIGVDASEGDRFLCASNKIQAWRDACLARLDEIESQKKLTA